MSEFALALAKAVTPKDQYIICKKCIDAHLEKFLEVGIALLAIKEKELFTVEVAGEKEGAESFTEFVTKHYESRARAFQMLGAAETRQILEKQIGIIEPDSIWTCEYHYSQISSRVHELAGGDKLETAKTQIAKVSATLPPEQRKKAIEKIIEDATPTIYPDLTATQKSQKIEAFTSSLKDKLQKMIWGLVAELKLKNASASLQTTIESALDAAKKELEYKPKPQPLPMTKSKDEGKKAKVKKTKLKGTKAQKLAAVQDAE